MTIIDFAMMVRNNPNASREATRLFADFLVKEIHVTEERALQAASAPSVVTCVSAFADALHALVTASREFDLTAPQAIRSAQCLMRYAQALQILEATTHGITRELAGAKAH